MMAMVTVTIMHHQPSSASMMAMSTTIMMIIMMIVMFMGHTSTIGTICIIINAVMMIMITVIRSHFGSSLTLTPETST